MKIRNYLTPTQVAEILMVSPTRVRQWSLDGKLKAMVTPGGHRRFRYEDVEDFALKQGIDLNEISNTAPLRVLIIDDDVQFTEFLQEALDSLNTEVETSIANDGFSAGTQAQKFKPDVVLLDLMMPDIDGFQVCKTLKSDPSTSHIRVFAMTGYPSKQNVERIFKAGAETCFSKPFEIKEFLEKLGINTMHNAKTG